MSKLQVIGVIPGVEASEGFIFARRQVQQLRAMGVDITTFFLETRTDPFELIRAGLRFRKLVRRLSPDLVHAHYGTVTSLFCVLFSPVPVVITFRGTDLNPSSEFSWLRGVTSRWFSQISALFAREIICVSEELRQRLWWRKARVELACDGTDVNEFIPIPRDEARDRLGWSRTERVVLFNHGAAKSPNKRRDLVEHAVNLVRERLPSVRLHALEGQVPGRDMPLYMNASDVVVMASRFEGSPNVVREALACNVPVCSVRVGDVPEMLAGISNCVLVEPTPESMAEGLYTLIKSPVRSNGREFAARFSADAHVKRVFDVLQRAAAGTAGRRVSAGRE